MEHWQVLAHTPDYNYMLLYTCLDTKLFGATSCLHVVSRYRHVPSAIVNEYIQLARRLGIYRDRDWRPVDHGEGCVYDPMPPNVPEPDPSHQGLLVVQP